MSRPQKKEREFGTELHRGAEHMGFARVPVPDSPPPRRDANGNMAGAPRAKVYDLALHKDGLMHGIELKQSGTHLLSRSEFKPQQLPNLRQVIETGGFGWVGCVFHDTKRRFREVYFACSIHVENAFLSKGSVSLDWFRKWGIQLPQIKAPIIDNKTFRAKIYEDGSKKLARSYDFTPAHEMAMTFLGREPVTIPERLLRR